MEMQWDESYSIGNEHIDKQHKEWIDYYNNLDKVMCSTNENERKEVKELVLEKMLDYSDVHFRYEEEYMRAIGYPDTDKHWRLHKTFRNEIYQISRNQNNGSIVLNSEIMDIIKNWLLDHILKHDMAIRRFVESGKNTNT